MISYIWFSKYIDCSMEDLMDFAGGKVQIGATNLIFFFYLGFLSQPFTNHRTAGEEGGYFFNS